MIHAQDPSRDRAGGAILRRGGVRNDGGAMVWILALALVLAGGLIVSLLTLVAVNGATTFWPRPIHQVVVAPTPADPPFEGASEFLGVPVRSERYEPPIERREALRALVEQGRLPRDTLDARGRIARTLYKVGNREFDGVSFRWVDRHTIQSIERPKDALYVERTDWGAFLGVARAVVIRGEREEIAGNDGLTRLQEQVDLARARTAEIARVERIEGAHANTGLSRLALKRRQIEIDHARATHAGTPGLAMGPWVAIALGAIACLGAGVVLMRRAREGEESSEGVASGHLARWLILASLALALLAALEHPWQRTGGESGAYEARLARVDQEIASLREIGQEVEDRIVALRALDAEYRVELHEIATGRIAPEELSNPDVPMRLSQVVRVVPANDLSLVEKIGVYLNRWREFLTDEPRNANTEGGVLPVIIGTVTLVLLLTVIVLPLGVVAAIYLREYAGQGLLVSLIRIAVNNLAGVPSIVYGVFGLGFFCYTIGKRIDTGAESPLPRLPWWGVVVGLTIVLGLALSLAASAGRPRSASLARRMVPSLWLLAAALVVVLVSTSPYFHGFFEARSSMNSPTFGTGGILWAAVTLALLTLPVVIVATEEAIAAVPRSMREGSYGAGASRWQTVRHIVLPGALPGILTGAVLAIARGAGEVAPLMLVGVVVFAPEPPVDGEFPFLHADRSFLHLGYHIYELGFKSPDAEAARPLVWTTTLLLLMIVLMLNLAAFVLRARIRGRRGAAV